MNPAEISQYLDKLHRSLAVEGGDEIRAIYVNNLGTVSDLQQTDYDFIDSETLPANGVVTSSVRAPGGDGISGQAFSSGQYDILVRWLDEAGNTVREEGIASNREGGTWTNFSLDPRSPFVDIVIEEKSGTDQTASITTHYQ